MQERVSFEREMASLGIGQPQREHEVSLSSGEFGKAIARYSKNWSVPPGVFWLLKQSPTFEAILKKLDEKYLAVESFAPSSDVVATSAPNAEGVFTKGRHQGRRGLEISRAPSNGTFFAPVNSLDSVSGWDMICLEPPKEAVGRQSYEPPTLDEKGRWIEIIAHESVHAYRHVLGLRRPGTTAADRIRAAIEDEIVTRKTERKIVDELRKKFPKFKPYEPTTGSFDAWAAQRDFFPHELRRTYLEHFVLSERFAESRKGLADVDLEKYRNFVNQIDLGKRPLTSYLKAAPQFVHPRSATGWSIHSPQGKDVPSSFQQDYPNVLLAQRVIDARWRSVKDLDHRDLYRDAELEKMRQEHAKAFFAGPATYANVP